MRENPQSGVTLIEILIAVSLLSFLSIGMLVAMRLGFNTMDKTDAHLVRNRRVANSRKIIENEIDGFIPSYADYYPKPKEQHRLPFLQLEAQSMRFVTSYSLEDGWRGRARIAARTATGRVERQTRVRARAHLARGRAAVVRDLFDRLGTGLDRAHRAVARSGGGGGETRPRRVRRGHSG